MKINYLSLFVVAPVLMLESISAWAVQQVGYLQPPVVELVGEGGVDLFTGQVVRSQSTLAIGGELGLSHSVRLFTNHFPAYDGLGFFDKYNGKAHYTKLADRYAYIATRPGGIPTLTTPSTSGDSQVNTRLWGMRVSGPEGGHDFVLNRASDRVYPPGARGSNKYYIALGDQRHSLTDEVVNGKIRLTYRNPNGVEVHYTSGNSSSQLAGGGAMSRIVYPNGFTIYVEEGGVKSNTGYALKYHFRQSLGGSLPWSGFSRNPKAITAINTAFQLCSTDMLAHVDTCNVDQWPSVSFEWPDNPQDDFYQYSASDPQEFSVVGPDGEKTTYFYKAYDSCLIHTVDSGPITPSSCTLGRDTTIKRYSPRLLGVKTAESQVMNVTYSYVNDAVGVVAGYTGSPGLYLESFYWRVPSVSGRTSSATVNGEGFSYYKPMNTQFDFGLIRESSEGRVVSNFMHPGLMHTDNTRPLVIKNKGSYQLEDNDRNFVTSFDPIGPATVINYDYDDRGNLKLVTQAGVALQQAGYPEECEDPSVPTFYKYCNKPIWTKDANGNESGKRTDYTYHEESGQIASVTGPAVIIDGSSVRPKTTYTYEKLYAYYKKDSNSIERADDGIWMLSSEFSCRSSNASGMGCAGGNIDKVEKNYYYGPQTNGVANNLHLRGESVTAEGQVGSVSTRVTCYKYDKFGNQTSTTLPKGNSSVTSCP